MSNSTKTQKTQSVCPCASGDVNYEHAGDAYCPWCEHTYGPWVPVGGYFGKTVVPIDWQ